jgi:broad specificity phosphatase PhoE
VEIMLIRHGQPDWGPGGKVSNDPVLTELGIAQARRLATRP